MNSSHDPTKVSRAAMLPHIRSMLVVGAPGYSNVANDGMAVMEMTKVNIPASSESAKAAVGFG